jgi:hypothetical protein
MLSNKWLVLTNKKIDGKIANAGVLCRQLSHLHSHKSYLTIPGQAEKEDYPMRSTSVEVALAIICAAMCVFIMILHQGCDSSEPELDEEIAAEDTSDEEPASLPEEEPPEEDLTSLPEATPDDIWNYITEENPYTTWNLFPAERIPEFAKWEQDADYVVPPSPEKFPSLQGTVSKIYINDIALAAINEEPRDLPNGSIIIYEIYGLRADGTLGNSGSFAGRYKVEGPTARKSDWVTFHYMLDGTVSNFGPATGCHGCHEASENDYVWIDSPRLDAKWSKVPALGW